MRRARLILNGLRLGFACLCLRRWRFLYLRLLFYLRLGLYRLGYLDFFLSLLYLGFIRLGLGLYPGFRLCFRLSLRLFLNHLLRLAAMIGCRVCAVGKLLKPFYAQRFKPFFFFYSFFFYKLAFHVTHILERCAHMSVGILYTLKKLLRLSLKLLGRIHKFCFCHHATPFSYACSGAS